jgi:hypothetical protein
MWAHTNHVKTIFKSQLLMLIQINGLQNEVSDDKTDCTSHDPGTRNERVFPFFFLCWVKTLYFSLQDIGSGNI